MIDPGLSGKVVLITGGNSPRGIGAATARAFAAQGAAVFIHAFRPAGATADAVASDLTLRSSEAGGERTYTALQQHAVRRIVAEIEAAGGRAAGCEADLADADVAADVLNQAEAALGPVTVLVNNAAHCEPDTLLPISQAEPDPRAVDGFPMVALTPTGFDRHFNVNARAPALLMAAFARRLVARDGTWGRIVNVSTDGARGFATEVSYGASKYALESLSRAAAVEFGPLGITVNVASLGPIQTGWITPSLEAQIADRTPLRRVGRPEDVADAIIFLASHQARWITGQVVHVGGGHSL